MSNGGLSISVIVPVFNMPPHLVYRYLRSVTKQLDTWASLEVVVVDDGSNWLSGRSLQEVVSRFEKLDCRIVRNEVNLGLAEARRVGVSQSSGDYCFFLDGDDIVPDGAIATLALSVSSGHQEDIIDGQIVRYSKGGRRKPHRKVLASSLASVLDATLGCQTSHMMQGSLYRRTLLTEATLRVPHRYPHEDLITRVRILAHSDSIGFVDKPVYCYVLRKSSLSHTIDLDSVAGHLEAFSDWLQLIRNGLISESHLPTIEAGFLRKTSWLANHSLTDRPGGSKSLAETLQVFEDYRSQLYPLPINLAIERVIEQSEVGRFARRQSEFRSGMRSLAGAILRGLSKFRG